MPIINEQRLDKFMGVYADALQKVLAEHPDDYAYGPDKIPDVLARMRDAIAHNNYGPSVGVQVAQRELGMKPTRKALHEYLTTFGAEPVAVPPDEARIWAFAEGSRLDGWAYVDADGKARATTDGYAALVLGATTLVDAHCTVRTLKPFCRKDPDADPDLVPSGERFAGSAWSLPAYDETAGVAIDAKTPADKKSRRIAERYLHDVWSRAKGDLMFAEHAYATAPKGTKGDRKERLVSARQDEREAARAIKNEDHVGFYALRVSEACVDMRLVRKVLKALGTTKGTVYVTGGALEPLVIMPSNGAGIGVCMPFRE